MEGAVGIVRIKGNFRDRYDGIWNAFESPNFMISSITSEFLHVKKNGESKGYLIVLSSPRNRAE